MPHVTRLDDANGLVAIRYSGHIDHDEIARTIDEVPVLPGFRHGMKGIADFRGATMALTGADVRDLAYRAKAVDHAWGDTKWALIAYDDLIYGLSRMYSMLTADYEVKTEVFRTVEAADAWLALETPMHNVLDRYFGGEWPGR